MSKTYQVAFSAKVRFCANIEAETKREAEGKIFKVDLEDCKIVQAEQLLSPQIWAKEVKEGLFQEDNITIVTDT